MDETYIQVKGKWTYFYRAVDKFGKILDFMLSEHRDEAAAGAFFTRTIKNNGWPEKVVIDKSGANLAGLQNVKEPIARKIRLLFQRYLRISRLCCILQRRPIKLSHFFDFAYKLLCVLSYVYAISFIRIRCVMARKYSSQAIQELWLRFG